MFQSIAQQRGVVSFPEFTGERIYMQKFFKAEGLPPSMRRWQGTIDAMLEGIDTDLPIYMMVDQGEVLAGQQHRRAGLHIDGYWEESLSCHGGGGRHRGGPANPPSPGHTPGRHTGVNASGLPVWKNANLIYPEALVLASDVKACRAFVGNWEGEIGDGGDCSAIDVSGLQEIMLEPNRVYAGNVGLLHESLPMPFNARRTLVRLNVPGWTPQTH